MPKNAVITLSSDGWVTAIDKKADRILMNAFASDFSQSNMFAGQITSIQHMIYAAGQDVHAAGTTIANALEKLYQRFFDAAVFKCTVSAWGDNSGRYDLAFQGTVTQDGRRYDFGRQLSSANGKVVQYLTKSGEVIWSNQAVTGI